MSYGGLALQKKPRRQLLHKNVCCECCQNVSRVLTNDEFPAT